MFLYVYHFYFNSWLRSRGIKQPRINKFLASENPSSWGLRDLLSDIDPERLLHQDETTWFLRDCSREEAERLLVAKPDGTFLVRPSRTGSYALSIT